MTSTVRIPQTCEMQATIADAAELKPIGKVLLLDGYSSRTLACVRSWGEKKIDFVVGGESRWDMSLFSRYTKQRCVYTSPKQDIERFIADINAHCLKFGADHVLPTSEAAIMACSDRQADLKAVPLIPSRRELKAVLSKMTTLRLAESVGISVPRTMYLTPQTGVASEVTELRFPVVVKSESSGVMFRDKSVTSGKTYYASDKADLDQECNARLTKGQSVLLQEFIDGYGVGVSGLFSEGRPLALIGHRRIRESNPYGGPSAVAETIEIDEQLKEATTALVLKTGFTGPAMVEYKVSRRDGRAYFMEINGRFWGSILVAMRAGLDLPYLYWKMLTGREVLEEETRYKVGIRGRNLVGDTKCLLTCMKGKLASWPGEIPGRRAALAAYCASFFDPKTIELICTADDPLPFLARFVQPNS
jgi:predicted ATP-grasp superfamily ATP-dependent carboligase